MSLFLQDDLHEPSMIEDVEVVELTAEELAKYNQHTMTLTQRGKPKLVSGCGYEYKTKGTKRDGTTLWLCVKSSLCRGQVEQNAAGDIFTVLRQHSCIPMVIIIR